MKPGYAIPTLAKMALSVKKTLREAMTVFVPAVIQELSAKVNLYFSLSYTQNRKIDVSK